MIVHESIAAPSAILTQDERDEIDNRAVQEAWLSLAGSLPASTEQSIAWGEVFYSALELAEYLIGTRDLTGWRISFTTDGGPYAAALFLKNSRTGTPSEITASHPTSLALAFTSAIRKWMDGNAKFRC